MYLANPCDADYGGLGGYGLGAIDAQPLMDALGPWEAANISRIATLWDEFYPDLDPTPFNVKQATSFNLTARNAKKIITFLEGLKLQAWVTETSGDQPQTMATGPLVTDTGPATGPVIMPGTLVPPVMPIVQELTPMQQQLYPTEPNYGSPSGLLPTALVEPGIGQTFLAGGLVPVAIGVGALGLMLVLFRGGRR